MLTVRTLDDGHIEANLLHNLSRLHLLTVAISDKGHVESLQVKQGDLVYEHK